MADQTKALANPKERSPAEPVRSRWTPKPEQILILESIFNSGMVNPPKDETVRIRKLLEKFGSVGDANVFYWFQNRRSRSRRRQRQLQASLAAATNTALSFYEPSPSSSSSSSSSNGVFFTCSSTSSASSSSSCSSLLVDDNADDLFSISRQMTNQNSSFSSSDFSQLHFHPGYMTVYINGMASEVPRGPIDMKAMFGLDVMLVNSNGELVPMNEFGILLQGLQMGESYFLVSYT
nr:WUSCHEL-related homeobox 11B [Dioscorea oppositifolia]